MSFPTQQHSQQEQSGSDFDSLLEKSLESNSALQRTSSSYPPASTTTQSLKEREKQESLQAYDLLKSQPERYFFVLLDRFPSISAESDDKLFLCLSLFEFYYCGDGSTGWLLDKSKTQPGDPSHLIREKLLMGVMSLLQRRPLANFILSKIAQVFGKIFVRDYRSWSGFFSDLSHVLLSSQRQRETPSSSVGEELFLRVCLAVNDMIAVQWYQKGESDSKVHAEIKDIMRCQDVPCLVSIWEEIFKRNDNNNVTKKVQKLALKCLSSFTPWIDVSLTAKPETLTLIYNFLGDRDLGCDACVCLTEIVAKGMPLLEKMKLLKYLNVVSIFDTVIANRTNNENGGEDVFLSKTCILLSTSGEAIASGIKQEKSNGTLVVEYLFELALRLAKFFEVLTTVEHKILLVPFCNDFTDFIKREKSSLTPAQREFCKSFLSSVILKNLEYPEDCWDDMAQTEEVFPDFREALFLSYDSLMNGITSEATPLVYEYIEGAFRHEAKGNNAGLRKKELALSLLHRHPETLKSHPVLSYSVSGVNKITKIAELLCLAFENLHQNSATQSSFYQNPIMKAYLELAVRYGNFGFFKTYTKYLSIGLDLFYRSIKGGHNECCQFASAHLAKFLKSNKELISGDAPRALLLLIKEYDLANFADSFVDLNEALGFVCGITVASDKFNEAISFNVQRLSGENIQLRVIIPSLKAIGTLAKGLNDSENRNLIPEDYWLSLLELSIKPLLRSNYLSVEVLSACNFTVQRLLVVAKRHVLIVLGELFERCLASGLAELVSEVTPILSASTFRLKEQSAGLVASLIAPLSTFVVTRPVAEGDDERTALIELKKQFLALLNASLAGGLSFIFDSNDQILSIVLSAIQKCLQVPSDPLVMRSALTFITKLLPNISPITKSNFNIFCLQVLLPASFQSLISSQINSVEDSLGLSLLNELALFHITISVMMPSAYTDAMRNTLIKVLGFGEVGANQVITEVARCDQKTIKELFLAIFKDLKRHISQS